MGGIRFGAIGFASRGLWWWDLVCIDLQVVDQDVRVVNGSGEVGTDHHVAINDEFEMVSSWRKLNSSRHVATRFAGVGMLA